MIPIISSILSTVADVSSSALAQTSIPSASFENALTSAVKASSNNLLVDTAANGNDATTLIQAQPTTNSTSLNFWGGNDQKNTGPASVTDLITQILSKNSPSNNPIISIQGALQPNQASQNSLTTKEPQNSNSNSGVNELLITKEPQNSNTKSSMNELLTTKELLSNDIGSKTIVVNSDEDQLKKPSQDLIAQMMLGVMSQQIPQANAPISITPQKIDTTESSIQGLNGSTKVKNNAPTTQTISSPLATNINSSKVDAEAESNKNSFAQFTKFENPVELTSEKISKLVSELKSSPNQEKSLAVLEKLNPTSQATQTTDNVLASSMPVNKITNTDTNNHSLLNQENGKDASLNTSLLSPTQTITNGQVFNEQMKVVSQNSNVSTTQNLPTQFNSPDWGPALSQRVTWMVRDQLQNASITINPPHLGPIEVRLQTDATAKTTVQFFSNHAEVRQAITDQLPTLRHMMSDSGLQLGQADVSSGGGFNQQTSSSPGNPKRSRSEFILPSTISADSSQGIGLINTYA